MQLNGQTFRLRGSKSKGEFVLRKLRCFLFRAKVRMFRPIYLSRLICALGGLPYLLDMHARQSVYTRKEEVCFSIRCPFFFLLKEHETKPAHSSIISLDFNGTYIQIRTVQYTMQEIKNGTTNVLDPFETSLKRFSMDCFKEVASELF